MKSLLWATAVTAVLVGVLVVMAPAADASKGGDVTATAKNETSDGKATSMDGVKVVNYDVVFGTLAVMVVTSVAGGIYWLGSFVMNQFTSTFLMTVTVHNKEDMFDWLLQWMAQRSTSTLSAQRMTLSLVKDKSNRPFWMPDLDDVKPKIVFLPGAGMHMFTYGGRFMWMTRYSEGNPITTGWMNKPFKFEAITLSTFGRSRRVFEDLFNECLEKFFDEDADKTKIYTQGMWGDSWEVAQTKLPRSFESVILDTDLSQMILNDAREFLAGEEWYQFRGIPFRRGYLLYGPPGTGKTSFVQALAGELGLNIAYLSLSSKGLTDEGLNNALNNVPKSALILLEDVDAVFVDRNTAEDGPQGVSFSGLLNAIDGVASQEGRLFFMTTNHLERLDPALVRPGRCDLKVKLSYASRSQVLNMFTRFYPKEPDLAIDFADLVPQNTVSMAQLQGHFLKYKDSAFDAYNNASKLIKEATDGPDKVSGVRIDEWLRRLGLTQYLAQFEAWKLYHLSDIKSIDPNELCGTLGIRHMSHVTRIRDMMQGKDDAKRGFTLANKADIKATFSRFYKVSQDKLDEFASLVQPESVSVFQIEAHCANYPDDPDAAIRRVEELINDTPPLHSLQKETVNAWLARMGVPQGPKSFGTIEDWLAKFGIDEVPEKFAENDITTMEQVIDKFDEGKLTEYGFEKDGVRWRMADDLKRLKGLRVYENFAKDGITDMNQVMDFGDGDLERYGIANPGQRWAMCQELSRLKEKQDREKQRYEQLIIGIGQTPRYDNNEFPIVYAAGVGTPTP